jgi:hypothetical protein
VNSLEATEHLMNQKQQLRNGGVRGGYPCAAISDFCWIPPVKLLHAMPGAMDRNVINYLNRPGTMQMGGHQSSWSDFYQGLGEALWNVSELFESGRYAELGGEQFSSFEDWYNGAEMIDWQSRFSTVAKFYHAPEEGTSYPFLLDKAAGDVGSEPFITTRRVA